jgi:hypothetical protein
MNTKPRRPRSPSSGPTSTPCWRSRPRSTRSVTTGRRPPHAWPRSRAESTGSSVVRPRSPRHERVLLGPGPCARIPAPIASPHRYASAAADTRRQLAVDAGTRRCSTAAGGASAKVPGPHTLGERDRLRPESQTWADMHDRPRLARGCWRTAHRHRHDGRWCQGHRCQPRWSTAAAEDGQGVTSPNDASRGRD